MQVQVSAAQPVGQLGGQRLPVNTTQFSSLDRPLVIAPLTLNRAAAQRCKGGAAVGSSRLTGPVSGHRLSTQHCRHRITLCSGDN